MNLADQRRGSEARRNASSQREIGMGEPKGKPGVRLDWSGAARTNATPDLLLLANDSTIFHVHRELLVAASESGFSEKLSTQLRRSNTAAGNLPLLEIPYSSAAVNILLCTVYNEDVRGKFAPPSLEDASSAILALEEYDIPLKTSVSETSFIYSILTFRCQNSEALQVYTLAASHAPDLHHVAVYASRFLKSINFSLVTEELADSMGSVYLLRLYKLLTQRTSELKRILRTLPQLHESTHQCDTEALKDAWMMFTGPLIWSAPNVNEAMMDGSKASVIGKLRCGQCKKSMEQRVDELKRSWSLLKSSI